MINIPLENNHYILLPKCLLNIEFRLNNMNNLEDLLVRSNGYLEKSISLVKDINNCSDPVEFYKSFCKVLRDESASIEKIYKGNPYETEIKSLTIEQRNRLKEKIDDYKELKKRTQYAVSSKCDVNWSECCRYSDEIFISYLAVEIVSDFKERELSDAEKLNWAGYRLNNVGKYSEALGFFDASIKKSPKFILAWINKGMALKNLSKIDEAIECYDNIINKIDSYDQRAWSNKASAFLIKNDLESANECVKRLDKIDPDYQFTKLLRLKLREANGDNFYIVNMRCNAVI